MRGKPDLDRKQAMDLLKALADRRIIDPDWVSVEKTEADSYKLKIKTTPEKIELERFVCENKLSLEEKNGYWLISEP
jgi:hypothetical protein